MISVLDLNTVTCNNYLKALMTLPMNENIGGLPVRSALLMIKQFLGFQFITDINSSEYYVFKDWVRDQGYTIDYNEVLGFWVILSK